MTQAIPLTPPSPSAIAVILLTGPNARSIAATLTPRAATLEPHQSTRATLTHHNSTLDDALLLCLAPDRFELHLHGSPAILSLTLNALQSAGATLTTHPTPQTLFPNDPLLAAEAAATLPLARTATALSLLAAQPANLTAWATHWLDYLTPNAPLWPYQSAAQWLLDRSSTLNLLLHPPRIAIIGPPNAGKSTLANALLGRPVAVTSNTPGTTRDWIDATATLSAHNISLPVTLIDTAGIRLTPDPLEAESIARTHHQAATAHALLVVLDHTTPPDPHTTRLLHDLAATPTPTLLILNKTDLPAPATPIATPNFPTIPLSARQSTNLDHLQQALLDQLHLTTISPTEPWLFTPRQRHAIEQSATAPTPTQAKEHLTALVGGPP